MSAPSSEVDVVVIGAGHNGLAATALLAKRGLRVACFEKNAYPGGMAGTREILSGCRNDVGASLLFPLAKGLEEELELRRYGVELIDLPIMATNLSSKASPPAVFYANPARMALYVLRHFGVGAMVGFARLMAFCSYPASLMHRFTPRSLPRTLAELLAGAPDERRRAQIRLAFAGSAMDLVDRFLPDSDQRTSHRARCMTRRAARGELEQRVKALRAMSRPRSLQRAARARGRRARAGGGGSAAALAPPPRADGSLSSAPNRVTTYERSCASRASSTRPWRAASSRNRLKLL
jgi:hypothetical protein